MPDVFKEQWQPWNQKYEAAKTIFNSAMVKNTIIAQHYHLYSEISITKKGFLRSGADLLKLLKNGFKGGRPRFFTYVLKDHTWYFSETGASFFSDFTSKHAMHACVSDQVRYAGEFHFQKNDNGTYRLVIDNNSGTYAPKKDALIYLKKIFELNFPDLEVEVIDHSDPKMKLYKQTIEEFQ